MPKHRKKSPANSKKTGTQNLLKFGVKYRFKKGVSGNPQGRPKSAELNKASRAILSETIPGDKHGRTFAEGIAETLANRALAGNIAAASELADRAEGRPRMSVDFNDDHDPLKELTTVMSNLYLAKYGKPKSENMLLLEENPKEENDERSNDVPA